MSKQSLAIRLDNPCSENWANMTPTEKGKFCASCKKEVYDARALTDNQLLAMAKEHPEGFCGRFSTSQLNRKLIETQLKSSGPRVNTFIAGLMIAVGAGSASAQSAPSNTVQTQVIDAKHPTGPVCIKGTSTDSVEQIVKLRVMDTLNNQPVVHAWVYIPGTTLTAISDSLGFVSLTIPKYHAGDTVQLVVHASGWMSQNVNFIPDSANNVMMVAMTEYDYPELGGAIYYQPIEEPKKEK